jgi:hypothetical protein
MFSSGRYAGEDNPRQILQKGIVQPGVRLPCGRPVCQMA